MKSQVKNFLQRLNNDKDFKQKFKLASKKEKQEILSEFLEGLTFEEFKNEIVKRSKNSKLADEDLEFVAGGSILKGLFEIIEKKIVSDADGSTGKIVKDEVEKLFCSMIRT